MNKLFFLPLLIYLNFSYGQTPSNDLHWQLLWKDDFNSLNTEIWNVTNNDDHGGEPEMYRTQNCFISNGNLVLRAKQENYSGHSYTSGEITTNQPFNLQYGYIEARIKLPYGNGLWPAFWTWTGDPDYQ